MASRQKFSFSIPQNIISPATASSADTAVLTNDNSDLPALNTSSPASNAADNIKNHYKIHWILRNKIRENKKNHYPREHIEEMKESILNHGLLQNLLVAYLETEDMYVLEAGHTRTLAIDELVAEFEQYPPDSTDERYMNYKKNVLPYKLNGYPCIISGTIADGIQYDFDDNTDLEDIPIEVIDSEIRVIITNEIARTRTPAVIAENISRLDKLYKRKNQTLPHGSKLNVNKTIAGNLGISDRQVKNYKAINGLIPELKAVFEENNISLKEGAGYAKLSEDEQKCIYAMIQAGQKPSSEELKTLRRENQSLQELLGEKTSALQELETEVQTLRDENMDLRDENMAMPAMFSSAPSGNDTESEIEKLKNEIAAYKLKEKSTVTTLNDTQAKLAKTELAVKSSYHSCKKEIQTFLKNVKTFTALLSETDSDTIEQMDLLSCSGLDSYLNDLQNLLILED